MRAAVMDGGERPAYGDFAEPRARAGARVVDVCAAALTGLDRNIAQRAHYAGGPVRRRPRGRRARRRQAHLFHRAPVGPFGSMAERTLIDPQFAFAVPDGTADDVAAALGDAGLAAWLAPSWRARLKPGESVLILGRPACRG